MFGPYNNGLFIALAIKVKECRQTKPPALMDDTKQLARTLMPPCQELWSQWLWRHYISYLSFLNWNNLGLVIVPYNNGTLGSIDPWLRCKPVLSSLCSVHRSPILWLSRWISANKQSHQLLRMMSSNWQVLWYHYAKSFEANATTSFTCHFKTKPIWVVCLDKTTMASLLLWLSRWKSAFKPSEWPWCMMSRNWQRIWCHHAKGSEANDSEA